MKLNKMNKSLIGILVALAAVSCTDELVNNDGLRPAGSEYSDDISFVVYDNNSTTRGGSTESRRCGGAYLLNTSGTDSLYMQMEVSDIPSPLPTRGSDITLSTIEDISMTCRMRTSSKVYNHYFADLTFSKSAETTDNGTYIWKSTPDYYWLDANTHFNFYGYAPADAKGVKFNSNSDSNYIPTLDYTVPETASEQTDLVYHDQTINTSNYDKESENNGFNFEYIANAKQVVPLNMKHALSKVIFKTGSGMAAGTIKRVTIKNVYDKGVLDLSTGNWNIDKSSTKDFYIAKEISGDNQAINDNADGTYFFLLPQSTTAESFVEIIFHDGEKDVTYTSPLDVTWEAGKQYSYVITISPELEIDLVPETQDAHYVIAKAHITASETTNWEIRVDATNLNGTTVSVLSELDDFQAQGFWTDKIKDINGNVLGEARGNQILKGTGNQNLYIFIPENISDTERTITIKENKSGKELATFNQLAPAWVGDFGWEQTDDNKIGQFGFQWNRKVNYAYLYTATVFNWNYSKYENYCQEIINNNNAGSYSSVKSFSYRNGVTSGNRYYIEIDYSKLSSLNGYDNSHENGLENTIQLNSLSGAATTGAFETTVKNILKTENGHTTEEAFRIGDGNNNEAPAPTGNNSPDSPAIGECLKKNRYNYLQTTSAEGDIALIPQIKDEDIVWFLPAVDQFNTLPTTVHDPINPADYWSSTANMTNTTDAYLGSGTSDARLNTHKIRACRMKP